MHIPPKAPPVYKPTPQRLAAPPVYRPNQFNAPGTQLKPATNFRLETLPAPPVYRPQLSSSAGVQPKIAGSLRIEKRTAPPVYKPQSTAQNLQPKACHACTQQPAPGIATPARNCTQPKSLLFGIVIQRASRSKCAACQANVVPVKGKCPACKAEWVEASAPLRGKAKAQKERRDERERVKETKEDAQKKLLINELGTKKGVTAAWDADPNGFWEPYAGGITTSPRRTTAPKYPIKILDITNVAKTQPLLAEFLEESLLLAQIRPKTPEHQNDEGKLPGYAKSKMAYWEFSCLGGGIRLVVDAIAEIVYLSNHYSYFYQLLKGGKTPRAPVTAAQQQKSNVFLWERLARKQAWEEGLRKASPAALPGEPDDDEKPPIASSVPLGPPLVPSGVPLPPTPLVASGLSLPPTPAISSASLAGPSPISQELAQELADDRASGRTPHWGAYAYMPRSQRFW